MKDERQKDKKDKKTKGQKDKTTERGKRLGHLNKSALGPRHNDVDVGLLPLITWFSCHCVTGPKFSSIVTKKISDTILRLFLRLNF